MTSRTILMTFFLLSGLSFLTYNSQVLIFILFVFQKKWYKDSSKQDFSKRINAFVVLEMHFHWKTNAREMCLSLYKSANVVWFDGNWCGISVIHTDKMFVVLSWPMGILQMVCWEPRNGKLVLFNSIFFFKVDFKNPVEKKIFSTGYCVINELSILGVYIQLLLWKIVLCCDSQNISRDIFSRSGKNELTGHRKITEFLKNDKQFIWKLYWTIRNYRNISRADLNINHNITTREFFSI